MLLLIRYKRIFSVGTMGITTYNPQSLEVTNQVGEKDKNSMHCMLMHFICIFYRFIQDCTWSKIQTSTVMQTTVYSEKYNRLQSKIQHIYSLQLKIQHIQSIVKNITVYSYIQSRKNIRVLCTVFVKINPELMVFEKLSDRVLKKIESH